MAVTKKLLTWATSLFGVAYGIDTPDTATPANNSGKVPLYDPSGDLYGSRTPTSGDNSKKLATTEYVDAQSTGANISASAFWQYKVKTGTTSGYPGDGFVLYNNASQIAATALLLSHLSRDGIDLDRILPITGIGDTIYIQDAANSTNFQQWLVTASLTGTNTGAANSYWTVPVSLVSSGGTGTTGFSNNRQVLAIRFTSNTSQDFNTLFKAIAFGAWT